MKVKEIERTANVAWSPSSQYPVYLACGTAAQQLDATFSTKSALEVFRFNPEDPGLACAPVASVETDHRFSKVSVQRKRILFFVLLLPLTQL